jgi:DNA repair and recombination protein RAD54B
MHELRDLFTIYSRTPCHTHDLLGCGCSAINVYDSQRSLGLPGSDSDSEIETGWVVASQLKPVKLEKTVSFHEFLIRLATKLTPLLKYIKKKKAELASLAQWAHVNCMLPSAREKIHDDILRRLIPVQEVIQHNDTTSPDPPKSRVEKLLAAVDSTAIFDTDDLEEPEAWDMRNVKGGQLTYIFERKSDSKL